MVPRYRINTDTFLDTGPPIGGEIYSAGDEIEYEGLPGPHMDALNEEAVERLQAYYASFPHMKVFEGANVQMEQAAPAKPLLIKKGERKQEGMSLAEAKATRGVPGDKS